eukprot:gene9175-12373_t
MKNELEEELDAKDFNEHLREANELDLSELEQSGSISQGVDQNNNVVIVVIPRLGYRSDEKSETIFRNTLLLFIRKTNEIVGHPYSIVYAHTSIDLINQYPLIYKFYSILPRSYKKNLLKMYIIHPNVAIRMFFEFARVFLSAKFYNKLVLSDNILDFQKLIPPTQLALPLKFLRKEDEDRGLKYHGNMASLSSSFDPSIGTTRLIEMCIEFLRVNGLRRVGLFRIAGDEGELTSSKIRLQYLHRDGKEYTSRISLSNKAEFILIGDLDSINSNQNKRLSTLITQHNSKQKATKNEEENDLPDETSTSVLLISDVDSIAQILKMSIRDLSEPLVSDSIYRKLIQVMKKYESTGFGEDWGCEICTILAELPKENLSTLSYIVRFLREVAGESAINNMDSNNLAIIFSASIFRTEIEGDPMKALAEFRLSQGIIRECIDKTYILDQSLNIKNGGKFRPPPPPPRSQQQNQRQSGRFRPLPPHPPSNNQESGLKGGNYDELDIAHNLPASMMDRVSGGVGRTNPRHSWERNVSVSSLSDKAVMIEKDVNEAKI